MKKKTHYAAPGADETFLRPATGGQWAPREIAVCAKAEMIWTAWIHRNGWSEYPVLSRKDATSNGELIGFGKESSNYSKPVFIDHINSKSPDVALFSVSQSGKASINIYETVNNKNIGIKCLEKLSSSCSSVYHMDALTLENGDIYIVYGGIAKGKKKISVYLVKRIAGTWSGEQELAWPEHSLNRPKLVADINGSAIALADVYADATYSICWIDLSQPSPVWHELYTGQGWNMFPSVAVDTSGRLWASWLNARTVRFKDVAGIKHHAMLAVHEDNRWQVLENGNSELCADLNLGLLPLKRYFGYDGLRRYPRLAPLSNNSMLLLWEQQKDEEEIWENLANGYLLGKIVKNEEFSETIKLADHGCCFAFDNKKIYQPEEFSYVVKSAHDKSGNDFVAKRIDLADSEPYQPTKTLDWSHWKEDDFKGETDKARNIAIPRRGGSGKLKLYWGDLHCHSVLSPDAEGEIDELYNFARDVAGLDFVALTDNDFYPPKTLLDSEINYIANVTAALSEKDFLALSGYEWTFHRPDANHSFNHRIVIYPDSEHLITARRNEAAGHTEKAFVEYLKKHGYFAFPHHGYWQMLNNEPAVEVTAGWGPYIKDADTVSKALNEGRVFSFLGNSDSHRFMPGLSGALTGVFAEALTHDAIVDAIKQGRCFATTGNRTVAWFYVNDCFMGGHLSTAERPVAVKWQITPHHKFESVTIIRDGQPVHRCTEISGEWLDREVVPGQHWYLLEVKEEGEYQRYPHNVASAWGKFLWTSPVWIKL